MEKIGTLQERIRVERKLPENVPFEFGFFLTKLVRCGLMLVRHPGGPVDVKVRITDDGQYTRGS